MIKSYNDMQVETKWATPNPGKEIREALTNTMADVSVLADEPEGKVSPKMLKFLFDAEHSSVIEHAVISVMVQGASRSWLAQITRHRMASMTSSSQHYQNYSDYPFVVHPDLEFSGHNSSVFNHSTYVYKELLNSGVPREEARQVLPNAMAVNFKWTINARSLYNFMRLRMCLRNVAEIRIFCDKMFSLVQQWWPEYADILGPPCYTDGKCNQGSMTCGKEFKHVKDM
jgi:thymidylate synthase (FAD)